MVLGGAALLGAGITAFYMTRVMLMTFFGEKRWEAAGASEATGKPALHPHEAPRVMTWPMIVLAAGSVASGGLLAIGGTLQRWLEPVVGAHEEATHAIPAWVTTAITLSVVAVGIAVAYRLYGAQPVPVEAPAGSALTVAARKDLYGDAFNEQVFMRPGAGITRGLTELDDWGIDGSVSALASAVGRLSGALRMAQTGFARSYALSMLAGAALVVAAILAVRFW
jgi:NADH-quinone oxidoreductase subunit L